MYTFTFKTIFFFICLSAFSFPLFSQTKCQGVLGAPLVNISFGAGTNPGPPITAATSVYKYEVNDCPQDGFYAVRNNTSNCFYGDWHNLTSDHTGNPNGYFLLVNASFLANDFYLDTIHNLCASTTYEFAAWILNILKPTSCTNGGVRPNITFRVEKTDGTVLQSFTTNSIDVTTTPEWKQYAFYFTTTEASVVLRMTNNNVGGCGGDFALDDITLRPCGPKVIAGIDNSPLQSMAYHCKSKDTAFTFTSSFSYIYTTPGYLWETSVDSGKTWLAIAGANKKDYTQSIPSTKDEALYLYRLFVGEAANMNIVRCRFQSNNDTIKSVPEPIAVASSNTPVCAGNTLLLNASGGVAYNWEGTDGFTATGKNVAVTSVKTTYTGQYQVKVVSQYGCYAFDSLQVTINPKPTANAGLDTSFCEGKAAQLKGSGGDKYLWSPAKGLSDATVSNPFASPVDTTIYTLKVTNQFNCVDTASVAVNILKKPWANAGANKQVQQGGAVQLDGAVSGSDINYSWAPNIFMSSATVLQPLVSPENNTTYTLTAVSKQGCGTAKDEVAVTVLKKVEVPNAFSPNNDGINDTWLIKNLQEYASAEISIFDRYGQKIFTSRGYNTPWNGNRNGSYLPVGTYYYVIDLKIQSQKIQGSVMIIR